MGDQSWVLCAHIIQSSRRCRTCVIAIVMQSGGEKDEVEQRQQMKSWLTLYLYCGGGPSSTPEVHEPSSNSAEGSNSSFLGPVVARVVGTQQTKAASNQLPHRPSSASHHPPAFKLHLLSPSEVII